MVYVIDDLCRMRVLMCGVYVGLAISSTYGFSLLADHLRHKYKMSQSDITTVITVGNSVGYFRFQAGMMFDYFGPKVVLITAGIFNFLGFFLFGLAFDDYFGKLNVVHFSIFNAVLYLGFGHLDVPSVMPIVLHLPLQRGFSMMIQKTFNGLGTAVIMAYFNGWFKAPHSNNPSDNNYSGYAYFLGTQVLVCALVGAYFIDMPMYQPSQWTKKRLTAEQLEKRSGTIELYMRQYAPSRRLKIGFGIVIITLIFSIAQSIGTSFLKASYGVYVAISIIALLLMISFTLMALPFQFLGPYTPVRPTHMYGIGEPIKPPLDPVVTENENANVPDASNGDEEVEKTPIELPPQYSGSFYSHLLTFDLWAMWFTCLGIWGTGVVMNMNAAQIYTSKNYGHRDTAMLTLNITMMAVGSAVGRMSLGFFDQKMCQLQREGRAHALTTIALPVCSSLLAIAFVLFIILPPKALLLPFFLGSAGTGAGWVLCVLAVRMMYAEDIGKHYNFLYTSGVVAMIVLNSLMFGKMYDRRAHQRGESPSCNAPICVRDQMLILMAVGIFATFTGLFVHLRLKTFTRKEYERRAREKRAPTGEENAASADANGVQ